MPGALNPFVWDRPLDDPSKIVGMEAFATRVALTLKGQTNVALFGPRDTGKTTFTNQLALELARSHGDDAPPFDVVKVNLQRVVSMPGFIGCVHDAMTSHPNKRVRRAAQRQIERAGEGDRVRHQGDQGHGEELGARSRAGRRNAARPAGGAAIAVRASGRCVRRVPAPAPLPRRPAVDHPLRADELGRQPRLAAVHRLDPQRAADDARDSDQPIFGEATEMQLPAISRPTSSSTWTSSSRRPTSRPMTTRSTTCSARPVRIPAAPSSSPGSAGSTPIPGGR